MAEASLLHHEIAHPKEGKPSERVRGGQGRGCTELQEQATAELPGPGGASAWADAREKHLPVMEGSMGPNSRRSPAMEAMNPSRASAAADEWGE